MNELASLGYQVIRKVLSADDITSMREAITETIDRVAGAMRKPFSASCPEASFEDRLDHVARHDQAYGLALFRAVMADAQRDPRIEAVARHPRLTPMLSELLSPMRRTGQVIRPRAVVSAFSSSRQRWHQDVVRPNSDGVGCGSVRVACWMPITDVDEYSGALELIPGVWREPLPHLSDSEGRFYISDEQVPALPRRTVPLQRGDVLILDRFVPHRSLPVQHCAARWAVSMWVKAAANSDKDFRNSSDIGIGLTGLSSRRH
jgi:ectoine hydroxylase-related dioxygenase (phytanoyl-CoA dioxygenase family)